MMEMTVSLGAHSYPIYIERGCTKRLDQYMNTACNTLIVCDDNIPNQWVDQVSNPFAKVSVFRFPAGEENKTIATWQSILEACQAADLNRKSQIIALGGGVTGDMAGFAAACYMRGIDFYNIPTTVLSQVDSSVGGKTAIDLGATKNIVGAFWQPKAVFIDEELLETLDRRQIANGLAEAVKMGVLFDEDLLKEFEKETLDLETIIARSIDLKRIVVEQDEKEAGLRRALNFGHTIGHALEGSYEGFEYLHGECVGAGMLYFIEDEALYRRILSILDRLGLPRLDHRNIQKASALLRHDKKSQSDGVWCVFARKPGQFDIRLTSYDEIDARLEKDPYEKYIR